MKLAPGLSFSFKRAIGLTAARQRFSRRIGIPTTRSGIERKIGRTVLGGTGCLIPLAIGLLIILWIVS